MTSATSRSPRLGVAPAVTSASQFDELEDHATLRAVRVYCQTARLDVRPPSDLSQWTDATRARRHARLLVAAIGRRELAERAQIKMHWIRTLCSGLPERGLPPISAVPTAISVRICAVQGPAPSPASTVSALGLSRRMQALLSLGWSPEWIAAEIGTTTSVVRSLAEAVTTIMLPPVCAALLCTLYDDLQMTLGPSRATAEAAKQKGYRLPLDWDDSTIDLDTRAPAETPTAPSRNMVDAELVDRLIANTARGSSGVSVPFAAKLYYIEALRERGFEVTEIARALRMAGSRTRTLITALRDPRIDIATLQDLLIACRTGGRGQIPEIPVPQTKTDLYVRILLTYGLAPDTVAAVMRLPREQVRNDVEHASDESYQPRPAA